MFKNGPITLRNPRIDIALEVSKKTNSMAGWEMDCLSTWKKADGESWVGVTKGLASRAEANGSKGPFTWEALRIS
ncbi:MAG: hypothetical protein LR011_07280 [Verrucomicrobia bacterium]|nr:hypothetical protein [Verrucomicrobiota bacterium]